MTVAAVKAAEVVDPRGDAVSVAREGRDSRACCPGQFVFAPLVGVFASGDSWVVRDVEATVAPAGVDGLLDTPRAGPAGAELFGATSGLAVTGDGATDHAPAVVLLLLLAVAV